MDEKLIFEECSSSTDWDNFILKSENKNILSMSDFIDNSNFKNKKIFIKKKEEILASFHIFYEKKNIILGDRIYSPINFKHFEKKNQSSDLYKKFNIINYYAKFLIENFNEGFVTLDHFTQDLRPFFWFNFDNKKKIFLIDEVRYTSIIKLQDTFKFLSIDQLINSSLFNKFSRSIKQQLRSKLNSKFKFIEEFNFDFAIETITMIYNRQKRNVDFDIINLKKIYQTLHKKRLIKMFITYEEGEKIAFSIFGVVKDRAIYLNGGRTKETNDDYSLTYNLAMSIIELGIKGARTIDLEGVNSPNRSFWKLGFGGDLLPYYKISMKKN